MPPRTLPKVALLDRRSAAVLLLSAWAALAQTGRDWAAFEAASVKPVQPGLGGAGPLRGGPGTNSPGLLSGTVTLRSLVTRAYELKNYQVDGPAWMESERYEIAAKVPAGAGKAEVARMLQTLLEERFGLAAHRQTRELPVYALVIGKNGPKLRESAAAAGFGSPGDEGTPRTVPKLRTGTDGFPELPGAADLPRSYEVVIGGSDGLMYKRWARRETMAQLADRLSSQLNRAVIDRTGLKGPYDFTLSWTVESAGGVVPRTDPPPDEIDVHSGPVMSDAARSIFGAVQSQLGLRLEAGKGPLEMLIVDRVEKVPTAN